MTTIMDSTAHLMIKNFEFIYWELRFGILYSASLTLTQVVVRDFSSVASP